MKEKLLKLLEEAEDLCNTTPCYRCDYEEANLCQSRILIDKILQQFDIVEKGSQQPKPEQFLLIEEDSGRTTYIDKSSIESMVVEKNGISMRITLKNGTIHSFGKCKLILSML